MEIPARVTPKDELDGPVAQITNPIEEDDRMFHLHIDDVVSVI